MTVLWVIVVLLALGVAWLAWEVVNLKQMLVGVPVGDDELYDLIHRIDNELGLHNTAIGDLQERLAVLEPRVAASLQHIGVVNYDAFDDIGGGRSRSIAFLSSEGSGFVVSVLVSRTDTSFYLKRIIGGAGEEPLSPEESAAINRALQG